MSVAKDKVSSKALIYAILPVWKQEVWPHPKFCYQLLLHLYYAKWQILPVLGKLFSWLKNIINKALSLNCFCRLLLFLDWCFAKLIVTNILS